MPSRPADSDPHDPRDAGHRDDVMQERVRLVLESLSLKCTLRSEIRLNREQPCDAEKGRAAVYLATAGQCSVGRAGKPPIPLVAGDFLCLTAGESHRLSPGAPDHGSSDSDRRWSHAFDSWLHAEDPALGARLIAGSARLPGDHTGATASILPEIIYVSLRAAEGPIQRLAEAIAAQAREHAPGSIVVLERLVETLLIEFARRHVLAGGAGAGWMRGITDPEIGPILEVLLREPEKEWTVASLAQAGGMSRSTFARRFREATGLAPMDLVVELRMRRACQRMRNDAEDLKSIARDVGYGSTAAFGVAFKRWSGKTPSDYRTERSR